MRRHRRQYGADNVAGRAVEEGDRIAHLIGLDQPNEWHEALAALPHAFGHTWESCRAMSLTTRATTLLYVWESTKGRAALPFSVRSFQGAEDLYTPYGFGGFTGEGDCSGLDRDWRAFAQKRGFVAGFISVNPVIGLPAPFPPEERFAYNRIYLLDLTKSEADAFAALSENRKRQIRASQKGACKIIDDHGRCAEFLRAHTTAFLAAKGASLGSLLSPPTMEALLASHNVCLLGAGSKSEVHAVCMFACTKHMAEYFLGVSSSEGRQYSALLIWEGARRLRQLGIPWLNLGGGIVADDGVARFKERFGGETRPLECLKQVYDDGRYRALCAAAACDADTRAGYFPPYQRAASGAARGADQNAELE